MIKKKGKTKFVSADDAAKIVKSGQSIYVHANCSYPKVLMDALCRRYKELHKVKIVQLISFLDAPYSAPEMEGHFHVVSLQELSLVKF